MVAGVIRKRGPPEDQALRLAMHKVREQHARHQQHDYSHVFRPKTRFELIRLCCIIMGIEFAYAAETAFVSPTLLEIGIDHNTMTMVWSLSPTLGFFLAPLMGSLSDRCTFGWGRRRPLILLLSLLIFIGLILVPWGKDIGSLFGHASVVNATSFAAIVLNATTGAEPTAAAVVAGALANATTATIVDAVSITGEVRIVPYHHWAVIFTILGTIALDFSADTCQTPARTYMLDTCISEDHSHGLSIFTVLAGLGGFMGYSLGGIDWESMAIGQLIGNNVKTVFTIVTVLFLISSLVTLLSFREIPLQLMERDELLRPLSRMMVKREVERARTGNGATVFVIEHQEDGGVGGVGSSGGDVEMDDVLHSQNGRKPINNNGAVVEVTSATTTHDAEKRCIGGGRDDEEAHNADDDSDDDDEEEKITLRQYLMSIVFMPRSMQVLCLTNLLSWMAHLSYSLYFTDFVGEAVFGGVPTAIVGSVEYELYQSGLRFGCWGMAIYALSCSLYSMVIEKLIRWFGAKTVYIGGLMFYGIGMVVLAIVQTKWGVLLLSISAGVIYATLFTLPYMLLANYHASGSFKMKKGENVPLKKTRGLGTDVAVISSMMFVAQIIISLTIGKVVAIIGTSAVIYAASFFSVCAALMASQVLYMDL